MKNKVITLKDKSNILIGRDYTLQNKEKKFFATFTDYNEITRYCEFLKDSPEYVERHLIKKESMGGVTQIFTENDLPLSQKYLKNDDPEEYSNLCKKIEEVKK